MCLKGGLCTFGAAALSLQDRPIATKKERILEILALKSELLSALVKVSKMSLKVQKLKNLRVLYV